jgi:hypothetical protein
MITSPSLLNLLDPKFLTDWIEALGRVAKGLKALAYLPPNNGRWAAHPSQHLAIGV